MKSVCLVLLMMSSALGFKFVDAYSTAHISQALTQAATGKTGNNQQVGSTSPFTLALADATAVPPASASKVPAAKAKKAGAPACSRQPPVNHDAQVIPARNKAQWPQSRLPAEQQTQCQAQKPLHKPPPI